MAVPHISLYKDILVDFEVSSARIPDDRWLFNIENKIAVKSYVYNNSLTGASEYQNNGQFCFAEFPEGIYYWDTQFGPRWAIFEENIQKAYSDFIAEKAILGDK